LKKNYFNYVLKIDNIKYIENINLHGFLYIFSVLKLGLTFLEAKKNLKFDSRIKSLYCACVLVALGHRDGGSLGVVVLGRGVDGGYHHQGVQQDRGEAKGDEETGPDGDGDQRVAVPVVTELG